jgi:hypothetical protein
MQTITWGIGKLPTDLKQKLIQNGWLPYLRYMHTVTFFHSQFGSMIKNQFGLLFCNPNHSILNGIQCKVMNPDAPLLISAVDETPRVLVFKNEFNPLKFDGLTVFINNAEINGLEFLKTYVNIAILFTNVKY